MYIFHRLHFLPL
jgi:hypothetical protein